MSTYDYEKGYNDARIGNSNNPGWFTDEKPYGAGYHQGQRDRARDEYQKAETERREYRSYDYDTGPAVCSWSTKKDDSSGTGFVVGFFVVVAVVVLLVVSFIRWTIYKHDEAVRYTQERGGSILQQIQPNATPVPKHTPKRK